MLSPPSDPPPGPAAPGPSVAGRAADICRGAARLLAEMGAVALPEVKLKTGRRLDLLALARDGGLVAVEVKSCRADFLADRKWPEYLAYADRFYFAVDPDFPLELLPEGEGVIVADRWGGEVLREAAHRPLAAARRKAVTLRFARLAAFRAQGLPDPDGGLAAAKAA